MLMFVTSHDYRKETNKPLEKFNKKQDAQKPAVRSRAKSQDPELN